MERATENIAAKIIPPSLNSSSPSSSDEPKAKKRTPQWPDGPVHRLARRIGCRHPIKLPMKNALRLADALGYLSYGKTMALWEAENASLPQSETAQRPLKIAQLAALKR